MEDNTYSTSDCPTQEKDRADRSAGEYCGRGIIEYKIRYASMKYRVFQVLDEVHLVLTGVKGRVEAHVVSSLDEVRSVLTEVKGRVETRRVKDQGIEYRHMRKRAPLIFAALFYWPMQANI